MIRIAIIGGGVSGLTAAFRLSARLPGAAITLFEATDRTGGKLWTGQIAGATVERGADSWLAAKPWASALAGDLGLANQLVTTDPANKRTFIAQGDHLYPLPEGLSGLVPTRLGPIARSPLLSIRAKARIALEPLIPPDRTGQERSVAEFVRHRLGTDAYEVMVEPLLSGIYAGDGETLSIDAAFPLMVILERSHGSLIRGVRAAGKGRSGVRPGFVSLAGGISDLTDGLRSAVEARGVAIQTGTRIQSLQQRGSGFTLDEKPFDAVLVATDAANAMLLLGTVTPVGAQSVAAVPLVSTVTVALAWPLAALGRPPAGYGYVVPRREGRPALAATWMSSKWTGRTPPGIATIRVFLGRTGDEGWVSASDSVLVDTACAEVARTLSPRTEPIDVLVTRWPAAMPQYTLGHRERIDRLERAVDAIPGLELTGNYQRGVGIPDCIREAMAAADRLAAMLSPGQGIAT